MTEFYVVVVTLDKKAHMEKVPAGKNVFTYFDLPKEDISHIRIFADRMTAEIAKKVLSM